MEIRVSGRDLLRAVRGMLVRHGEHHLRAVTGSRARVGERRQHLDVGFRLGDPVLAGDAHVEQAVLYVERDLLGTKDRDALDAIVVDGAVIVAAGAAAHAEVRGLEQAERLLLEGAFGDDELQHVDLAVRDSHGVYVPLVWAPDRAQGVLFRAMEATTPRADGFAMPAEFTPIRRRGCRGRRASRLARTAREARDEWAATARAVARSSPS